jgi:predicted transcriptional regulator of viral defense system
MQRLTEILLTAHPRPYVTTEELAHYFTGTDDARYGLVKRAVAAGEIVRIRRGLYCLASPYRAAPLNLYALAQYVFGPSYISLESALSHYGWIPEAVYTVTSTCVAESRTFRTPLGTFSYTRVPQNFFYAAVTRETDDSAGDVALIARPIKALADYVYAYRKEWSTPEPALQSLRIDRDDLASVTTEEMDEAVESYRSRRVQRFLSGLRKEYGI